MRILIAQTSLHKYKKTFFVHSAINQFIEELTKLGHEVFITGSIIKCNTSGINLAEVDSTRAVEIQEHGQGFFKWISYLIAFLKFPFRINNFDVIYIFLPGNYSFLMGLMAFFLRKRIAIYLRVGKNSEAVRYKLLYKYSKFGFATGDKLNQLLSLYTYSQQVVPLLDFPQQLIQKFDLDNSFLNIIFVGRITKLKGVDLLIDAFSDTEIKELPIRLHLVGEGSKEILDLAGNMPNVFTYGVISERGELFELLRQCDVFCLPSLDEGFPRVLYEAAYSKCAILTTFVGSIESMMQHDLNCMRLGIGSEDDIKHYIKILYEDSNLRERLQREAYKFYLNKFDSIEGTHADQFNEALIKYI